MLEETCNKNWVNSEYYFFPFFSLRSTKVAEYFAVCTLNTPLIDRIAFSNRTLVVMASRNVIDPRTSMWNTRNRQLCPSVHDREENIVKILRRQIHSVSLPCLYANSCTTSVIFTSVIIDFPIFAMHTRHVNYICSVVRLSRCEHANIASTLSSGDNMWR